MVFTALLVAILAISASAEDRPCLPTLQEFWGTDSYNLLPTYYANSFPFNIPTFAFLRNDGSRVVKIFLNPIGVARVYAITLAGTCSYTDIKDDVDIPRCIPATAEEEDDAWVFKNTLGDTLHYSKENPSKVLKRISADKLITANYRGWNNTISKPQIMIVPDNCTPSGSKNPKA